MKRVIGLTLVLALLLCGCGQTKPANPYRLKEQTYISYNRFENTYNEPWIHENLYDEQGRFCGTKDNQGNSTKSTVDAYGNIIQTVFYKDGVYRIGITTYDEYDNPLEQRFYYSDEYNHPIADEYTGEVDDIVDRIDTWTYERIPE